MARNARQWLEILILSPLIACGGCIEINLPEGGGLLGGGTTFVANGIAESIENNGSCLVWRADDGRAFVLFQSSRVASADFDTVTTLGVRARLELTIRSDIGEHCRADAIVAEVQKILSVEDG